MTFVLGLAIFFTAVHLIQHICYFVAILKSPPSPSHLEEKDLPSVSVCMSARDEEACIELALEALSKLDYPTDKLEIWIADDQSSDKTPEIIQSYADKFEHIHFYPITNKFKGVRGKQNALANVIKESDTELIAIVDADIEVKPKWLRELTSYMDDGTSMVCGVTAVKYTGSFTSMAQHFDWVYAACMFKAHSELGIPISGLGNNQLYRRSAYEELGGYENLRYSVNEDHRIFSEMCETRGHGYKQVLTYNGTNLSMPIDTFMGAVRQRYRWLKGGKDVVLHNQLAMTLPFPTKTLVIIAIIINWKIGLILLSSTLVVDAVMRVLISRRIGVASNILFLPFWYVNTMVQGILIPLCFFFAKKITWRGRKV